MDHFQIILFWYYYIQKYFIFWRVIFSSLYPSAVSSNINTSQFYKANIDKNIKYAILNNQNFYYVDINDKLYFIGEGSNGIDGSGTNYQASRDLNGFEVNLGSGINIQTKSDEINTTLQLSNTSMNISVQSTISGVLIKDNKVKSVIVIIVLLYHQVQLEVN